MNSMNLLASDGTIVGVAVLHEESNQFHGTSIPPSYCVLSLSKCISPYPLEIPDPFENYTDLSQLNQELSLSINNNKEFSDHNLAEPSIIQGFATRLGHTDRNMGLITRADIICRRAGTASNKSTELRNTRSVAIGCPFKVTVLVIFDPGYRKLSNNEKAQIQVLHNNGVPIPTIINMLTEEYSRYIHSKDVYNALNYQARDRIKGLSQVAELLNNLQNKDKYKITYSVKNNRLHSLFFTTSDSLMTFEHYSEVILMDSTYKTNRFGMPLLLISGVDAMGITFLIASRLISDETVLSFCWVLQQLKQIAGNTIINKIQTILTDKDLVLLSSICNELSHVKHQLCIWHLEQNLIKNLTKKLGNKFTAFSKDFKTTMIQNTEELFKPSWDQLLIMYPEVESYMNEQ
ncbi:9695_t:CDS:2 [Cetraspora pellucida]|uniref:9695_t:CDS:1 n=1 Tax=Cetraspora pellucida TaxID=1433469 RepID=A0ACA9NWG8_9GLOM|nr:9695_t:CDS:2 [Cetraspora pellucida]